MERKLKYTKLIMTEPILVIGNKNYSSWSLRPWLFLRKNKLAFKERQLWLDIPEFKDAIADYDSGGKVPLLLDGDLQIWDSLAIIESAIDRYDCCYGWPREPGLRAHARSISCEMHSSFMALREQCPMDVRKPHQRDLSPATRADIARIMHLWEQAILLSGSQGRWLYGDFSAADAMFAPVVFRFLSYGVKVSPVVETYLNYVQADPAITEWREAAAAEQRSIEL